MFNIESRRTFFIPFIFILLIFLPLTFFIDENIMHKIYGQESAEISKENSDGWQTFSNSKFSFMYPENWKLEKKLSKFHVLDAKLIKDNPFSFLGISFSFLPNSEKLTNDIVLQQAEDFGKNSPNSIYSAYEILEKNLTKYSIDGNPSASHIVQYQLVENGLDGKLLEIYAIINNNLFTLDYRSTIENFDTDLPVINKIINSLKITK